jgi:hypothetical protein
VRAFATRPGMVLTPLQRHISHEDKVLLGWINDAGQGIDPAFRTAEQGAATQTWVATSPLLADIGGVYCGDCDVTALDNPAHPDNAAVAPYAVDDSAAERLWALSAQMTGVGGGE